MEIAINSERYKIEIDAERHFQYLVRMTLFDAENNIVLTGSEYPLSRKMPRGLYTIRLDSNGSIKDKVILLGNNCRYRISHDNNATGDVIVLVPPPMFSAAPLDEKVFASSRDYLEPAIKWSNATTVTFEKKYNSSSVFLFFRFYEKRRYRLLKQENKQLPLRSFRLLDSRWREIVNFSTGQGVEINYEEGWMAFNAMLPAGFYLLEYTGPEPRQLPVYLLDGMHTQLFLMLDEQPVFSSLRVYMQEDRLFDPYDLRNIYTDLLFVRLQNNDYYLEAGLARSVRDGMLPALMLHLLYAYMVVSSGRVSLDDLYLNVMGELYETYPELLGPLPDWRAICILGKPEHTGYRQLDHVRGVPMINIGYQVIKSAAVDSPESYLIRENSLNDLIAVAALYDSLYTTFTPVGKGVEEFCQENIRPWSQKEIDRQMPSSKRVTDEENIWQYFFAGFRSDTDNWLELLIYELASGEKIRDVEILSCRLQVPVVTITRIVKDVRDRVLFHAVEPLDQSLEQRKEKFDRLMKTYEQDQIY
jgi:hypothetical protein